MAFTSLLPWESLFSTSHLGGLFGEGGCDVDEVDVDDLEKQLLWLMLMMHEM